MQLFNLTPASISYLNQFLLSFLISIYLGWRWFSLKGRRPSRIEVWLQLLLGSVMFFSLLLFLAASFPPEERLLVVYAENTVLAFLLLALIQFAYSFPRPDPRQNLEKVLLFALNAVYLLWEAVLAGWRYARLADGQVEFRLEYMDLFPALFFLWVILVFVRSAIRHWQERSMRWFAWTFLVPFVLAILNLLRTFNLVTTPAYHIAMSTGILFTIFFFALNYLSSQQESISLLVKSSAAILTAVLAVTSTLPWLLTPAYAARYPPAIRDQRTLQFTPNAFGGYDIHEAAFHYEALLGEKLDYSDQEWSLTPPAVDFSLPFYGQQVSQVYISSLGSLGMGSSIDWRDFQYHLTSSPAIIPPAGGSQPQFQPGRRDLPAPGRPAPGGHLSPPALLQPSRDGIHLPGGAAHQRQF
jgi:hypothetical protein